MIVRAPNTTIGVLQQAMVLSVLWIINTSTMTTGKRFAQRTKDHTEQRVLDARTRAVLENVVRLPRGKALSAYLRATRG